ncbi:MAG: aminotransferase class V-fold PLP-dependent enzyme, partial [Cytophagales bacterium]|nr:aminotransferase class V-fold PLP-dependent enzyme [Cytophagales bacterium]
MTTFYPGPSKVYPQVRQYLSDAYDSGILSVNHRSAAFMEVCEKTFSLLHEKLNIPADYAIVFVSSATECWEIIAQSFVEKASFHLYNGAFGQKWFEYTNKIKPAFGLSADIDSSLFELLGQLPPPNEKMLREAEMLCLTHNETSNGTQISTVEINTFRQTFPDKLVAVDTTSSLGGADLPIAEADLWFASVQKCLGLPAGLGLLIVSPRAVATAERLGDNRFYNSFNFMRDNALKLQTHYTPNVLGI